MNVNGRFIVNDLQAELELVRRGLVLAQTVGSIVKDEIARGELVEVLDEHAISLGAAYLYFPSRAQMPPRLRVFIDHFRSACGFRAGRASGPLTGTAHELQFARHRSSLVAYSDVLDSSGANSHSDSRRTS